ncbi:MAG: hypothetical protein LBV07_00710 [Syntrophobacterales bacterium]|jgi:ABC-type glycerol-3-phosphate transport system substrate-binding protein|nr:hypothetical protein [Syntrophobacterales bacterium]
MFRQRKDYRKGKNRRELPLIAGIVWLAMALFLSGVILPTGVWSHPAKKIILNYNKSAGTLSVTIQHPSSILDWHYIKTISISKNKENPIENNYENQPGNEFTYTYTVAASSGDTLTVTAACSLYETTTARITIP